MDGGGVGRVKTKKSYLQHKEGYVLFKQMDLRPRVRKGREFRIIG